MAVIGFAQAGPAIHVLSQARKSWMPGTRPGMTKVVVLE
jgi:hypothetical protein